jgi:hypothetical protein
MVYEDAFKISVATLRQSNCQGYGYDLYIPNLIRNYLCEHEHVTGPDAERQLPKLSPLFYEAAWELCRRGIIRPGVRVFGEQATSDGSAGNGYSVTGFGRTWLAESHADEFIPTEPERFGQMIAPFKSKFGAGFHSRAQEAVRCYGAHAYLACCAMCGAAAESILLALAIAKLGDETKVLGTYAAAGGRGRIENAIIGQADADVQREFKGFTVLMKYWRDEAGHGKASTISDNEAYTSLALMLRFAQYAGDRWKTLTT